MSIERGWWSPNGYIYICVCVSGRAQSSSVSDCFDPHQSSSIIVNNHQQSSSCVVMCGHVSSCVVMCRHASASSQMFTTWSVPNWVRALGNSKVPVAEMGEGQGRVARLQISVITGSKKGNTWSKLHKYELNTIPKYGFSHGFVHG